MAWNKKTNPTVTGKYLVAVNNGTGKVSFEIGYWSNDLSKIDASIFDKGTAGWYTFKCNDIITYEVLGWMEIPEFKVTKAIQEKLNSTENLFE